MTNGGDLGQLHTSLGGAGAVASGHGGVSTAGHDAASKHKQLSELLRSGAVQQQPGGSPSGASMALMGGMKACPGPQNVLPQGQQHLSPQQASLMQQQQQIAGMVGGMNRAVHGPQKGNGQQQPGGLPPQQQGMMGGQMLNGTPRMGYHSPGMGSNSNLLVDTLQQAGGGQGGMRAPQPGALNKVRSWLINPFSVFRVCVWEVDVTIYCTSYLDETSLKVFVKLTDL